MEHLSGFGSPLVDSKTQYLKSLMFGIRFLHAGYLGPRNSLFQYAFPITVFPIVFARNLDGIGQGS